MAGEAIAKHNGFAKTSVTPFDMADRAGTNLYAIGHRADMWGQQASRLFSNDDFTMYVFCRVGLHWVEVGNISVTGSGNSRDLWSPTSHQHHTSWRGYWVNNSGSTSRYEGYFRVRTAGGLTSGHILTDQPIRLFSNFGQVANTSVPQYLTGTLITTTRNVGR